MNTLYPSRKPAAVRRAGGYLFLLAGFNLNYGHRTMRAVVCALWVLTAASCTHATGLSWLPGDNYSWAAGVSGDGSVVVGVSGFSPYESAGASYRAFRWTTDSGMVSLGYLPGDNDSLAAGVSGDGTVVVGTSDHYYNSSGQAFRWTAGSGIVGLGYLPGYTNSSALAVSGNGSVVVGSSGYQEYVGGPGNYQAFRWTAGSGMVGLGYLPGGTNSAATAASADGSIIVGTSSSASGVQAFRWTAGSGMVGLGYLPGDTNSVANGVSADGSVIVGTSFSASDDQAFRWTAGFGMVGLGYLPGDNNYSAATAISADGSIIVGNDGISGFRWTAGSGMQSVWDLLVTNSDPASDLTVYGISADGNTIVGSDDIVDSGIAFVATLPGLIGVSPTLSINSWSSAAQQLVLSWSTNYTGCTLQSSTDPGSTNWTDCASPAVSGASFVVTNSMSAGAQFFRLKR